MTSPTALPATSASSTLYFGPWYRRSPFFEKTLEAGCSAYDIYNHMYLPGYYADPIEEYWALLRDVTVWDVAVERIVEISGPDASALPNMLISRDPTTSAVGPGNYVLSPAEARVIVNDPVLLPVAATRLWLILAHSDPARRPLADPPHARLAHHPPQPPPCRAPEGSLLDTIIALVRSSAHAGQ